ncbi:MAG: T9SS type A sorting domain-containing protein [Ignavibacteria bacterium]|nr:T9SS type A sorting domain-containing protein [Ignavibacteria bacterium]
MSRCLIVCLILLLLRAADVRAQQDSTGYWISRSPLPTPRQEVAHAVLNGKIYVPGGLAGGGTGSTVVDVFDPASNSWSSAAPLPEPLHHLGLATANSKLYVLGGYVGNSFIATDHVYEFDPDSNSWQQKSSMLVARGAHVAIAFEGKIYVMGGVQSGVGVVQRNDEYDPVADSWRPREDMPTPREHLAGAVIDSLIYVVGGRVGSSNRNTLEAYSPATDTWYTKASMPTARGGLAAAALNGRLYAFGGEIPGVFSQNEEYNPQTDTWREMAPMVTPRHGIGAATFEDSIFVIGGGPVVGFGVSDANEAFTLTPLTGIEFASPVIPSEYVLYQNYPNPFNPSTTIEFDIPGAGLVSIKLFDLQGKLVRTLLNEMLVGGHHILNLDASELSSGVYLYRIQTDQSVGARKMVLLR